MTANTHSSTNAGTMAPCCARPRIFSGNQGFQVGDPAGGGRLIQLEHQLRPLHAGNRLEDPPGLGRRLFDLGGTKLMGQVCDRVAEMGGSEELARRHGDALREDVAEYFFGREGFAAVRRLTQQ